MNSVAAHDIAHFLKDLLDSSFRIHLGPDFFQFASAGLESFFEGAAILLCYWPVLFWMYWRKLFLKI
jgi:hypothetical protein